MMEGVMSKVLSVLLPVFAVVLTLAIGALAIGKAFADSCLGYGFTNMVAWTTQPASTNADANGNFEADLVFCWQFTTSSTRFGPAEVYSSGCTNIVIDDDPVSPAYSPAYFSIPSACQTGTATVNVTGKLQSTSSNGTLSSYGSLSLPFEEDWHQLTVIKP
jgi:hypothetical protein